MTLDPTAGLASTNTTLTTGVRGSQWYGPST